MTAVQMGSPAAGTRSKAGLLTQGKITRVGGQPEIALDQFLLPMVLASDAVLGGGELIGDPTEGALVALAAKGGVDATATRQSTRGSPRCRSMPRTS